MAVKEENILDALAWADFTEKARIAIISSNLARESGDHTKTYIKEKVRETCPPYGRGKAITEAVEREWTRQRPIYVARQQEQAAWKAYLEDRATRETRLNAAYAAAFKRPLWEPSRRNPIPWGSDNWDERNAWEEQEK